MGKKGILAIVPPAEFKERTSLLMSSRSPSTQAVDSAYEKYYFARTEDNRSALYQALRNYLFSHGGGWSRDNQTSPDHSDKRGGDWSRCERNKVSGGLLEYLYNQTAPDGVYISPARAAELDRRAAERIRDVEIPHARYGVLYFLANIELDMNFTSVLVDGIGAAGGAISVGATTNYGQLSNASLSVQNAFSVGNTNVNVPQIATLSNAAIKGAAAASGVKKHIGPTPKTVPVPSSWSDAFPTTEAALTQMSGFLGEAWNATQYLGLSNAGSSSIVSGLNALPAAAVMAGAATVATVRVAGAVVVDLGRKLWEKLSQAFAAIGRFITNMLSNKVGNGNGSAAMLGSIIKQCTKVCIDKVMSNAVPFLQDGIDVGTGIARTLDATYTRLEVWAARRKIRIKDGHPQQIAEAIQEQMELGMLSGLVDILKGGAKLAASVFLPGLGSVISVFMSAIEWMIKFVYRWWHASQVKEFLKSAKKEFEKIKGHEKSGITEHKASTSTQKEILDFGYEKPDAYKSKPIPGTIITDSDQFTQFFQQGCDASPLIPMLVLNSGLAGSLMTFLDLFEPDGRQSARGNGGPDEFQIGGAYFNKLKLYSAEYMKSSGFKFNARKNDDQFIHGLLMHATGATMVSTFKKQDKDGNWIDVTLQQQSHVAAPSLTGKIWAFAKA